MVAILPSPVLEWFTQNHYTLTSSDVLRRSSSARVTRVRAVSPTGTLACFVYKRCAPDRDHEIAWLRAMQPYVQDYAAHLYRLVETNEERGLLLQDYGESLAAKQDDPAHLHILMDAAVWLAGMHIHFASPARRTWPQGTVSTYPVDDARAWSQASLSALQWCLHHGVAGVSAQDIATLQSRTAQFYGDFAALLCSPITLTHGDPHLDNLVQSGSDFRLIDWEFAAMAPPQRDISILLQDLTQENQRTAVLQAYTKHLFAADWPFDYEEFMRVYNACAFENTLLMLGWDIEKHQNGAVAAAPLGLLLRRKLRWLDQAFRALTEAKR